MRRRVPIVIVGLTLLSAACAPVDLVDVPSSSTSTTAETTPTSTLPPVANCPGAGEFGEGRGITEVEDDTADGRNLGEISWEASEPCESFQFLFETSEGAPAITVPDIRIEHLDSFQVLRISLDIDSAVVSDQLVETNLVDRLYVVRALDGAMFVDLHLNSPAAARARVEESPARLTVDLRPGLVEFNGVSSLSRSTVVVAPGAGPELANTTAFSGYVRGLEAEVAVIVTQGNGVTDQTSTIAADHPDTWGEFATELTLPSGEVSVFVGEVDPEDGGLDGVTVDLRVG
jgi:hypothetical protein